MEETEKQGIRTGQSPSLKKRIAELENASGHPIYDLFEKYSFQRPGLRKAYDDAYAEDENQKSRMRAYADWFNDGQPTGITSDQEFYDLQSAYFRSIVYDFEGDETKQTK